MLAEDSVAAVAAEYDGFHLDSLVLVVVVVVVLSGMSSSVSGDCRSGCCCCCCCLGMENPWGFLFTISEKSEFVVVKKKKRGHFDFVALTD